MRNVKMVVTWFIAVGIHILFVNADRLDKLNKPPVTASDAGGDQLIAAPLLYRSSSEAYRALSAKTVPSRLLGSSGNLEKGVAVPIINFNNEPNAGDGTYSFSYESGNGISAYEKGSYNAGPNADDGGQIVTGSFSYTGPDNVLYSVSYTAGPEGFVPVGSHFPTPPPVPEAILRAIQYSSQSASSEPLDAENRNKPFADVNPKYRNYPQYTARRSRAITGYKH